jgi:1,4-alpha-glucan branching enzyme
MVSRPSPFAETDMTIGGVGFRVWAKFASAVSVAGTFNNWSDIPTSLTLEGNGYWSTDVSGAAVGDEYKFVITNPTTVVPWKRILTRRRWM